MGLVCHKSCKYGHCKAALGVCGWCEGCTFKASCATLVAVGIICLAVGIVQKLLTFSCDPYRIYRYIDVCVCVCVCVCVHACMTKSMRPINTKEGNTTTPCMHAYCTYVCLFIILSLNRCKTGLFGKEHVNSYINTFQFSLVLRQLCTTEVHCACSVLIVVSTTLVCDLKTYRKNST